MNRTFKLAPINPNVNNKYYDKISYEKALLDFLNNENVVVYDKYDNDTKYYQGGNQVVIGKIINRDLDKRELTLELDESLQFITSEEYVIGFKLLTNGMYYDENIHDNRYIIQCIDYAVIINKEFLK